MKNMLILGSAIMLLVSCKKESFDIPLPPSAPASTYQPMSVGSYWIYEHTQIDSNGVETASSAANDSVYVSRDTVIGGNTYAVFVGSMWFPAQESYRRDSSGYIVDQYGAICFSATNFTDTLRTSTEPSGLFTIDYKMENPGSHTVPAGTYSALDFKGFVTIHPASYPWNHHRTVHQLYADGVGMIRETTFFYSQPGYESRRLLYYHIE